LRPPKGGLHHSPSVVEGELRDLGTNICMMKKLVVLSGAGMSAESGIRTFRDSNGLWEEYDVMEVASIQGWRKNPELMLRFYNERRKQMYQCQPNKGHLLLTELEKTFKVRIITQNVDNLHERAGSKKVLHLHGELSKARSSVDSTLIYNIGDKEIKMGDKCEKGSQLRPFIVWFGEEVPAIEEAIPMVESADILCVIGTSLNVYPAAGLLHYSSHNCPIWLIDPNPPFDLPKRVNVITKGAGEGVAEFIEKLRVES
jgi:NAD-dependent deacetylase